MTTSLSPSVLRRALPVTAALWLAACDASFLHDVETRREATDRGCPAPNDGAHDLAVTLEPDGSITVTWTTAATNADAFVVERRSSREPTWGELGSATATSFNDTRTNLDEEYGYRVSAARLAGGSACTTPASQPVTVRTVPRAVETLRARGTGAGQITVSWTDLNAFEDGYRLTRIASGGARTVIPDFAAGTETFVDTAVTPGNDYVYELVAFNASGVSSLASVAQRAVIPPTLSWTDAPRLGQACSLEVFGEASYADGATFNAATGLVGATTYPGSATGFVGAVEPATTGPIATSWTVDDSAGGEGTLARTLQIQHAQVKRSTSFLRTGTGPRGEGQQVLEPACATCDATPLSSVSAGGSFTCQVLSSGRVSCWGSNDLGELGHGTTSYSYRAVRACDRGAPSCDGSGFQLTTVAAATATACGIAPNGRVLCWGAGDNSLLGRPNEDDSFEAVEVCVEHNGTNCVTPLQNATQIAMSYTHACALTATGEIYCWGNDVFDFTPHIAEPVCVDGTAGCPRFTADQISVGHDNICAVDAGVVYCWGPNDDNQLGTETMDESQFPTPVCTSGDGATCVPLGGVAQVEVGNAFACARRTGGDVVCWGYNSSGQTGVGNDTSPRAVPSPVCSSGNGSGTCTQALTGVATIAVGRAHACAVKTDGALLCWGSNSAGQTSSGSSGTIVYATPVCSSGAPPGCTPVTNAAFVAAGEEGTCYTTTDGRAWCLGTPGITGNAEAIGNGLPTPVCHDGAGPACDALTGVTRLAVGYDFTCGLVEGELQCWGSSSGGQLGVPVNGVDSPASEVQIDIGADKAPLTEVVMVQAGMSNACAIRRDGSVWCWGRDGVGQLAQSELGYGDTRGYARPVCLSGTGIDCPSFTDAVSVSVGFEHVCAVTAAGEVYCWGGQDCGEHGRNLQEPCDDNILVVARPNRVCVDETCATTVSDAVEVGAGYKYTCYLQRDGGVKCFGSNDQGHLGHGEASASSAVPVSVVNTSSGEPVPISGRVALRVGELHSCAVGVDGGVVCWGDDACGELGSPMATICNGTSRNDARPVCTNSGLPCVPLTDVIDVSPGVNYTCVLNGNGQVRCWGSNFVGELGLGFDNQGEAETIGTVVACNGACSSGCSTPLEGAVSISTTYGHACVAREDGAVYCWGLNGEGQSSSAGVGVDICAAQPSCAAGALPDCTVNDVGDVRVCDALSVVVP